MSKSKKASRVAARMVLRFLLVLMTLILLVFCGLCMILNLIFNGPSENARDRLTMSMLESSGMKWCPAVFIGEDKVAEIQKNISAELPDDLTDSSQIRFDLNSTIGGASDEWEAYPDGIRIERVSGDTYNAHVMIIRDPSKVYLATSNDKFSMDVPGSRLNHQMEKEGAIAGINAGAFWDNGKSDPRVGSVPQGLVVSEGEIVWNDGRSYNGFVGLNEDNVLVVAKSMSAKQVKELGIRDGCCFGPVLIMNNTINEEAYNNNSGLNPRTSIGQRADGAIIFLCIDGRQASSLGGTYADAIDILVEYGAVNACNLDGGSSSIMFYRDTYGRYGQAGELQMINNYSLLQEQPRLMPTFYMVRPTTED